MDNVKDSIYYLEKINNDLHFIENNTKNVTLDEFSNDELLYSAINFKFIQISENVRKIPNDFINKNTSIPWYKLNGLRNKLVHDYGNVKLEIIFDTIKKDIPFVIEEIEKLL